MPFSVQLTHHLLQMWDRQCAFGGYARCRLASASLGLDAACVWWFAVRRGPTRSATGWRSVCCRHELFDLGGLGLRILVSVVFTARAEVGSRYMTCTAENSQAVPAPSGLSRSMSSWHARGSTCVGGYVGRAVGKSEHLADALDDHGERLFARAVANYQADPEALLNSAAQHGPPGW
jgi:hypothetical protein